jgi:hypothetical protein
MIGRWMMIGFVAGLLSMAGCAAMTEKTMREKGLAPMTQSELEAFYSRNRAFNFANYAGWKGNGTSHVGGTIAVNPQGADRFEGKWRIAGGKYCTRFANETKEDCLTVYQVSAKEQQVFFPDGSWYASREFID